MAATKVRSVAVPVTPHKRYRLLIEWTADDTSNAITVAVNWLDEAQASIQSDTLYTSVANTANTWQRNSAIAIPVATARWAKVTIEKGNVGTQFAIARLEFVEYHTNAERVMSEILIREDFEKPLLQLGWTTSDLSGLSTYSKVVPAASADNWSEFGVVRIATGSSSGNGGLIYLPPFCEGPPPLGVEYQCKVRMSTDVNYRTWGGLWSSVVTSPDAALSNTISGIGFRAEPGGVAANWFGVVRNGTSETTVDLGVASNTNWRRLGWFKKPTGIQFTLAGVAVGSIVTTNLPGATTELNDVFGCITGTAAARNFDIDSRVIQGFINR